MADAGWHNDPWQRPHLRYFDGQQWTAHVSTNGATASDPAALTMPAPPAPSAPLPAPTLAPTSTIPAPTSTITAPTPVQSPKKGHMLRWILAGVGAVIVIAAVASAGMKDEKTSAKTGTSAPAAAATTTASVPASSTTLTATAIAATAAPTTPATAAPTTAAPSTAAPTTKAPTTTTVKAAMAEVTDVATSAPDALGWRNVTAKVTNNSSKRSNYIISVAVESADGKTQITTTAMAVNDLEPGQTTTAKGLVTEEIPADAKVVVKDVTRYAS